jgi:sec-independent protein translocase protein TatB
VFDIAFSELVVVGLVALVVLGPKRLPEMARAAGRWTARIRRFVDDVKRDMGSELRREELAELRQVQQQISETKQLFETTAGSAMSSMAEILPPESAPDYLVKAQPAVTTPNRAAKKRVSATGRKQRAKPKTKKSSIRHVRTGRKSKS